MVIDSSMSFHEANHSPIERFYKSALRVSHRLIGSQNKMASLKLFNLRPSEHDWKSASLLGGVMVQSTLFLWTGIIGNLELSAYSFDLMLLGLTFGAAKSKVSPSTNPRLS